MLQQMRSAAKWIWIFVFAAFVGGFLLLDTSGLLGRDQVTTTSVVATVNGTDIPYLGHLMAVAALVIEDGGDEDEAIAALLHDAVEDQGGPPMLVLICERFGSRVAAIVAPGDEALEAGLPLRATRRFRRRRIHRASPGSPGASVHSGRS